MRKRVMSLDGFGASHDAPNFGAGARFADQMAAVRKGLLAEKLYSDALVNSEVTQEGGPVCT